MIFFTRAAFCLEKDDKKELTEKLHEVMKQFLRQNNLKEKHIECVLFSQTGDLKNLNASQCLRDNQSYNHVALFTVQEAEYKNSIPQTVRLLIIGKKMFYFKKPQPVYTYGAEVLRPDWCVK